VPTIAPALLAALLLAPLLGAPRLDGFVEIDKTRLFPDHERPGLWYVAPAPAVLRTVEGRPGYRLDLFRYLGRGGTGDRGRFWARGVLSLRLGRSRQKGEIAALRHALEGAGKRVEKILSVPVAASRIQVLFGDMNATKRAEGGWSEELFTIGLDPVMAQLLWITLQEDSVMIAVSVEDTIEGVVRKKEEWEETSTVLTSTLPVVLDNRTYPDLFEKHDLGGLMKRGYTTLEIFDFDFVDDLVPDLYAEIVEIAIPTRGRPLVKRVQFSREGPYHRSVRFHLAKDLREPYRYRIVEIYRDGRRVAGAWREKEGETMLDVTRYAERSEK